MTTRIKTITATYRIVTPMFVSGADSSKPELCTASIKGALRFWWRALNYSQDETTQDLYRRESEIFGGASDSNNTYGQSRVLFNVSSTVSLDSNSWVNGNSQQALLNKTGLGLTNKKGFPVAIADKPVDFTVTALFKPKVENNPQTVKQVKDTLIYWGLMGGLGTSARKGFGSVALIKLDDKTSVNNNLSDNIFSGNLLEIEDYKNYIINITENHDIINKPTPTYTAFSKKAKIYLDCNLYNELNDSQKYVNKLYDPGDSIEQYQAFEESTSSILNSVSYDGTRIVLRTQINQDSDRRASPFFVHHHLVLDEGIEKIVNLYLYLPASDLSKKVLNPALEKRLGQCLFPESNDNQ